MQRIALIAGVSTVLFCAGCATPAPSETNRGRLPDPLLATRRPTPSAPPPVSNYRPAPARPAPAPPPEPEPEPTPQPPKYPLGIPPGLPLAEMSPRGGIRKGLWNTIVVHHSEKANATPQGMDAYHHQRGWENGLGYHFVIGNGVNYPDGQIFVGQRWKKQMQGAHCKSGAGRYFGVWRDSGFFNDHGIGICLIGNFEEGGGPTPKQLAALQQLIGYLCQQTGIPPSRIYGHGEITHKTACPGRNFSIAKLRQAVTGVLAGTQ